VLGRCTGLYGVRGWIKVFSHTQPREKIIDYAPLYLQDQGEWRPLTIEQGRLQGKGIILKPAGCDDRDAAAALLGRDLAVRREQLPELAPGEYYWADLQGLRVINLNDVALGTVDYLFETGANDVMVVRGERERLIPFVQGPVVVAVDLAQGLVRVDWESDF